MPRGVTCRQSAVAAILAAVLAAPDSVAESNGRPSFNCRKASSWAEKTICSVPALSDLDQRMADIYRRLGEGMTDEARASLSEDQGAWIADRNACERKANPLDCLRLSYEERLGALVDLEGRAEGELVLPPVINSAFVCEDGRDLDVAFHTREPTRVVIVAGRRTIDLPQTISASGARYSDGVTTFWNKGDQALFEWANGSTRCHARH